MFPTSSNPWAMIALALLVWPLILGAWVTVIGLTLMVCVMFPPAIPAVVSGLSRKQVPYGV